MGLDITVTQQKKRVCPHCGESLADPYIIDSVDSSGRVWYPFLEAIGYYVPYEQRAEENDWYGKDMLLTEEQVENLYSFVKKNEVYNGTTIAMLIAVAMKEHDDLVVNADW